MTETGTEFLLKLKAEAQSGQVAVILETTFAVALAVIMVKVSIVDSNLPEFSAAARVVLLWAPIVLWAAVALVLYRLAYRAYRRRFIANLAEGGLLLKLLDAQTDANFRTRVLEFARSYYRLAAARGMRAYPRGWRILAITVLTAAVFFWAYFLVLAGTQVVSARTQLMYDAERLLFAGCLAVLLSVIWTVIDRPRTTALRGAIAEALLRHQQ